MVYDEHDPAESDPSRTPDPESGKVGLALLMWLLGVPGSIVLLYLLLS